VTAWGWIERAVGASITLGLAGALPAFLTESTHRDDLAVDVEGPRPFAMASKRVHPAPLRVGPPSLLGRIQSPDPDAFEPGISLRTWRVVYGHRWEREVTWPVLEGPFHPQWTEWPCAFGLSLGPEMFDDHRPGGGDVESIIDHEIRRSFPIGLDARIPKLVRDAVALPKVHDTHITVSLEPGQLVVRADIVFVDGAEVAVDANLVLERDEEDPSQLATKVARARLLKWTGKARPGFIEGAIGAVARRVGRGVAEQEVRRHIVRALSPLALPAPRALLTGREDDRFSVRLCGAPQIDPHGVRLPLGIRARLSPELDPVVVGPVVVGGELAWPAPDPDRRLAVTFTREGMSQMVYLAWQAGVLSEWARDPALVASIEAKSADRLAFELDELELGLPPVITGVRDHGWTARVAQLGLGELDRRRVVGHADLWLEPLADDSRLGFEGHVERVWLGCQEPTSAGFRLTPCLSDVLPILRESDALRDPIEMELEPRLLATLTKTSFAGYQIRLSKLAASPPDSHGQMRITAHAEMRPEAP
jgi:hypothetical protein